MRQLISVVYKQIVSQIKTNEINMVRLQGFDNPIIYKSICELLRNDPAIECFIPKLTLEKYSQFENAKEATWTPALMYMHKGNNGEYNATPDALYANNSYVDFDKAITKWRNESPNLPHDKTSLVLLMGTEAVPDDAGSLEDTTFVVSSANIIELLNTDYSEWFSRVLEQNGFESKESRQALHTLYRAIFANININIFRFSDFVDELDSMQFATCQELVGYICETLSDTWGIPSIISSKHVPKVLKLSKGKLSDAKIITSAVKFIERSEDIPSVSAVSKLREKFSKYAENKIDVDLPFPSDNPIFSNYHDFEDCVIAFMRGEDLLKNRATLLQVDYAIIEDILGTKLEKKPSQKAPTVSGNPIEAYSKMILGIVSDFKGEHASYPVRFTFRVEKVSIPDCVKEQVEDNYKCLCNFMGGLLDFINSSGVEIEDSPVEFAYEDSLDPFDFVNYDDIKSIIKCTGKWGDPYKIQFKIKAENDTKTRAYEYKWAFSPYSPWINAFSYLSVAIFKEENVYSIPSLVACKNIQDYLRCESEDEFYAQLLQLDVDNLFHDHKKEAHKYFGSSNAWSLFTVVLNDFETFTLKLIDHGLYSALPELRKVVSAYTEMMDYLKGHYNAFTDVQKEKIALLANCFVISSNPNVVDNCDMCEVLLPAYHPVMLEKIDAQQIFLRDGFAEVFESLISHNVSGDKWKSKLDSLVQLSSITQGVDAIIKKADTYITCRSMWEYFGVYFDNDTAIDLISGNAFGSAIITDDEDASAMLHITPMSNVVVRNIMDYIRTFPARVDGLNVAFIAPVDMQHIVAAIHLIAKQLELDEMNATINLRLICLNSKKNSTSYLKRWLDSYFDDERNVRVNTFLRNITIGTDKSDADCIAELLENCDLCFNYNILESTRIQFDKTGDETITKEQAKFPMTFTPDTIPATHGKSRKVSISQFQFLAAKSHTQANYVIGNPNSLKAVYRTFKTLELNDIQNHIIELSHKSCKWVVCIDPAVDRRMLETSNSRIIGFTTGEGSYGELNVTVSARKDILNDIKRMLTTRISEKFSNWDSSRLQKAAAFCVDDMSSYMDGSRILKALNPYDYEIHSFLAYILTLQMLGLTESNSGYAVRSLISLDSYKHWFVEDDGLITDNKRPDFMLIEIPIDQDNLNPDKKLRLQIKIIECKMGFENECHLEKAQTQLEKGLKTMSTNWNPNNTSIMHRYWLNQLYRAIIFSPLNLDNTSSEYGIIRNKIFGILSGNYEIEWTGDIFAFWLDSNDENPNEYVLDSSLPDEMYDNEIAMDDLKCHCCGQLYIQKMLVPPDERSSSFVQNLIVNPDESSDDEADEEDSVVEVNTAPVVIDVTIEDTLIHVQEDENNNKIEGENSNVSINQEDPTEDDIVDEVSLEPEPASDISENQDQVKEQKPLSAARFLLGEDLRTKEKFYWEFGNKSLNNRHLLINGNSGCGKTYCIQTLLMEMVKAGVSGVVFDYTSGFTPDKLDPLFMQELGDRIQQRVVYVQKIPVNPFAKQTVRVGGMEVPEADTVVATRVANVFTSVYDFGGQQKSALYKAIKNGLSHHNGNMSFSYLEDELNNVSQKQAETVLSKIQPFLDLEPFAEDEAFDWGSIRDSGGMVYVMQLDGFDRPTQLLLTELLLWDIWNYCVKNGNEEHPFVIVMDEAQNLSHGEGSPSEKFLTEGRKFGISGWYATQFMKPQLTDDEIQRLQQAGQKLYFCPPDDGILTVAKSIDVEAQGAKEWAPRLKALKKGECVTCGNMVRNEKWSKYDPRVIKVTSLQERIKND